MLEKSIESSIKRKIEEKGGLCLKWVSPGNAGVPDRMVIDATGVYFIEVKQPKGKVTQLQEHFHAKLRKHGADVYVVRSVAEYEEIADARAAARAV